MKRREIVISKKQIVVALVYVLVIIVVANIAKAIYPVLSIPIGVLLGSVIVGSIFGVSSYVVIKGVIKEKNIKEKLIGTLISLVFIIPLLYAVGRGVDSVQDVIAGPQESIVYDIDVERVYGSGRVSDSYYFIGKVQEDDVKILKMHEEQYDYCLELIETTVEENRADAKYRIYYFENINSLYGIEAYE